MKQQDLEAALSSLLDAWRATRAPRVADLIDALSARLTADLKPIGSKKEWESVAQSARPAAFGRLLEALPSGLDRAARLERLRTWPADPRVATAARGWLDDPPVKGTGRAPFFIPLAALLEHTGDVRIADVLGAMTTKEQRSPTIAKVGNTAFKPLVALASALAAAPVKAADDALVTEIAELLGPAAASSAVDPSALFAAVYARADDDEPRMVLGDLLQQRGDPRGDLIALQLARRGKEAPVSAAERKLVKAWGRTWLGAIEPSFLKDGVVFERGFVERGRYSGVFVDGPEWATVTHLDLSYTTKKTNANEPLLRSPRLVSLRHVVGMCHGDDAFVDVVPWETVGFEIWSWRYAGALTRGSGTRFPRAQKLVITKMEGGVLELTETMMRGILAAWPDIEELEVQVEPRHVQQLQRLTQTVRVAARSAR